MADVPFYSNRDDNMSCFLACLRMAMEYFDNQTHEWTELEELTGYKPGIPAWTVKTWTELARRGYDIRMIEGFDYQRYEQEGESYLATFLKPQELTWQVEHTNLLEITPYIPEFLRAVTPEQRNPQLSDIDDMVAQGYLVIAGLNSRTLNDKTGYNAHVVLIYKDNGDSYELHDPGLPAKKARIVSKEKLLEAMGGSDNTVEVTGVKR